MIVRKEGYKLTNEEQFYQVFKDLLAYEKDSLNKPVITHSVLENLTGQFLNHDYVTQENDELTKDHLKLVYALGYDSFLDLYEHVSPEPQWVAKGGDKDLSRLNQREQLVMRNGKQMRTTVYEDPDSEEVPEASSEGASEQSNESKTDPRGQSIQKINYSNLTNDELERIQHYSGIGLEKDNIILLYEDDQENLKGLSVFHITGEFLVVDFISYEEETQWFPVKVLYTLLLEAWKGSRGILFLSIPEDNELLMDELESYNFTQTDTDISIEAQELRELLGDYQ